MLSSVVYWRLTIHSCSYFIECPVAIQTLVTRLQFILEVVAEVDPVHSHQHDLIAALKQIQPARGSVQGGAVQSTECPQ